MTELLRFGLLGGLLGLDGTAVGQFMISRPLVAGWLAGWVAGVPGMGIAIGAILELFLLVSFPTGGARFPEGSTAAVVAVGVAVPFEGSGAVAASVAMGLVWGQVGGWSVTVQRHVNGRLLSEDIGRHTGRLGRAHLLAIVGDFLRGAVVTVAGVTLGRAGLGLADGRWPVDAGVSTGVLYVGAAVSLGILLHDLGGFRRRRVLFVLGLAVGIVGARFL
jgi:mannose/fructose/N-acetylgalactosamine-specific phosphotransferase system component IIC